MICALSGSGASGQEPGQAVRYVSPSGTELRLLIDQTALPEVTVGEMTFPAGLDSGEHTHGSIEIFYVISGELEHVVNGRSTILKPGMAGFVKPPDKVRHKVGPGGPVKAVVIWSPGDEAGRVAARWKREP
jgi:quercetin dioxygenase-like cupin family protein